MNADFNMQHLRLFEFVRGSYMRQPVNIQLDQIINHKNLTKLIAYNSGTK